MRRDLIPSIGLHLLLVSRPYLWLVTLWLFLLPTGGEYRIWTCPRFWCGVLYCTLPLNILVYLMNDLTDVAIDKVNPRKGGYTGARIPAADLRALVPWAIALQAIFLGAIGRYCGYYWTFCWFAAVCGVNWRRFGSKARWTPRGNTRPKERVR